MPCIFSTTRVLSSPTMPITVFWTPYIGCVLRPKEWTFSITVSICSLLAPVRITIIMVPDSPLSSGLYS